MNIRMKWMCILLMILLSWIPYLHSQETESRQITYNQSTFPLYPEVMNTCPPIPSPYTTEDGLEIIIGVTNENQYTLIPVTLVNEKLSDGEFLHMKQGEQLKVDAEDFPVLAKTGLHSEIELDQTKIITGRSITEITDSGRPDGSSGAGFMARDEDIISVLKGDNRLVKKMELTHPEVVRPLFHVWNLMLEGIEHGVMENARSHNQSIMYSDRFVYLKYGGRGWQESIFNDEIQGAYHIEMWREWDEAEKAFLNMKYPHLSEEDRADLMKKLSHIHTGEMVPYYAMRYGFYEGHTDFRADPIAISFIFCLRSIQEIEEAFEGNLSQVLNDHFVGANIW
jgi:hypothetical protein